MVAVALPVQEQIREKIRRFDAPSLLRLLHSLGYAAKDLHFESNPSLASSISLFEDIFFPDQGSKKVRILINLGLLTGNSPLPTYFRQKMDLGTIDVHLFTRFLSFFDHHAILTTLGMSTPTENRIFFPDWNQTLKQYLSLLGISSTSTLWLFLQLCFPELKAEIHKYPRVIRKLSSSIVLGSSRLGGEALLGKKQKLTVSSLKIILTAEEMDNESLGPWPVEIKQRLKELIFPLIHRANIYTKVILVVKNCRDKAELALRSYLGYRTLGASQGAVKLLLFSGYPTHRLK